MTTRSPLLPRCDSHERFLASPRDTATYRPGVEAICRRHGLDGRSLTRYPGGSTIVFAVGTEHVVKLFEPIFTDAAITEQTVLEHVQGRLSIPTPAVRCVGELEGWRYVVMEQLPGRSLADAWPHLRPGERAELCGRIGRAVAELHALELPPALPGPEWPDFVANQAAGCVQQHRGRGLDERWAEQIPAFLARHDLDALARATPVLLHTEVMREHVLVERRGGEWEPSGLFDFEPARTGAPEYDLASVGIFVAAGEPGLVRAFLSGYGLAEDRLNAQLQARFLLHTLLHRYGNLRWYLDRLPPRAATLPELAAEWFAFD
jgi:hygromycin-B 7''-O-kinase